jgi:hypothetical protein
MSKLSNKHDDGRMENFYKKLPSDKKSDIPSWLPQPPFRLLMCAPSGAGKTTILLNLIKKYNKYKPFTKVYLYAKQLDEKLYTYFIDAYRKVEKKIHCSILVASNTLKELPPTDQFDKEENNLVIFDDFINDADIKNLADLWTMGRKRNCSCVFLAQSYYKIPQILRQNSDTIILKNIKSTRDLTRILSDQSLDLTKEELRERYNKAMAPDPGDKGMNLHFFLIDMQPQQDPDLRFRKGLQQVFTT